MDASHDFNSILVVPSSEAEAVSSVARLDTRALRNPSELVVHLFPARYRIQEESVRPASPLQFGDRH